MFTFLLRWHRNGEKGPVSTLFLPILIAAACTTGSSSPEKISAGPAHAEAPKVGSGMQASPLEWTNVLRSFATRGLIREFPAGGKSVVIQHEDIPGFMPKMTMEFNIQDTNELRGLIVGDTVTFTIKATQEESWVERLRRINPNEPAAPEKPADPSSAALLNAGGLKPGDAMPDATLVGEDGRTVRLSDFKGKVLAFTFIFTRCPLPDFCPRMNQGFSRTRDLLRQNPKGPSNWQFLSISFDPEFDQPGVLNRYAFSYRGSVTNQWLFAAGQADSLTKMSSELDFRFSNQFGSFQHNLRTVVLDPQQRVYRQFNGNKWTAEELAQAMVEAAESTN